MYETVSENQIFTSHIAVNNFTIDIKIPRSGKMNYVLCRTELMLHIM